MEKKRLQCDNFGKTIFLMEKRWGGKLFTVMKCWKYTEPFWIDKDGHKHDNIMAGWHTFYETEKDYEDENHDLVVKCPSYKQHLRDEREEKKRKFKEGK